MSSDMQESEKYVNPANLIHLIVIIIGASSDLRVKFLTAYLNAAVHLYVSILINSQCVIINYILYIFAIMII